MAAINPDWYAAQATRAYPLDDAATARDDAGLELPSQILVDCRIKFPLTLGRYAYLSGVTVSSGIVTAVLMATTDAALPPGGATSNGAVFQPLGAVSLPQPVTPNIHYPIQPMANGVGGWLVFGRGVTDNVPYSGRFSLPIQSLLLPRVAAAYHPLPISSLGKFNLVPSLSGVVQLLGGTDLSVTQGVRSINGAEVNAVVFGLVDNLNRNVYSFYAGPCGGRPESDTCDTPALRAINSVSPDCNGNLTINFSGAQVYPYADGGGLAVDFALGMADVCLGQDKLPDADGNLPGAATGGCPPFTPEPPLLSYWKLDEAVTGAIAVDSGLLGAHAPDNLGNTAASTTKPVAAPLHFYDPRGRFFPDSAPPGYPGVKTYLNAGVQPAHGFIQNFTVSAWVRCAGRITNQPFISHALAGATTGNAGSALGWNLVSQQDGLLAFTSCLGGNNQNVPLISEFTLPLNVWAFVAVVISTDTIYLYFNGKKSVNVSHTLPGVSLNVATCIGKDFSGAGVDNFYFNGDLDDIRIYNAALTDEQIQILADGNDPFVQMPPLVLPEQPPYGNDCVPLPYYESFDGVIPTAWTVINGIFAIEEDDSPTEPYGLIQPGSGAPLPGHIPGFPGLSPLQRARRTILDTSSVPIDASYSATDPSQRNLAIWNCGYNIRTDLTCTTELKIMPGVQANGGIAFNYIAADPRFSNRPSYVLAVINPLTNALELWVYYGASIGKSTWFPLGTGNSQVILGDWYQLTLRSHFGPSPVGAVKEWLVTLTIRGITNSAFVPFTVTQPSLWYDTPSGQFGLGTVYAHCRFSWFQLEATPGGTT